MLETRLILIEGLPGSGKTTLAGNIAKQLLGHGFDVECHLENDPKNPIELPNRERGLAGIIESFANGNPLATQWKNFIDSRAHSNCVCIVESRFWQNSLLFMLMAGQTDPSIQSACQELFKVTNPHHPVLIWLMPERWSDLAKSNNQKTRQDPEWARIALAAVTQQKWFRDRQLPASEDSLDLFFDHWLQVANKLFERFPGQKSAFKNPQLDWKGSTDAVFAFLRI